MQLMSRCAWVRAALLSGFPPGHNEKTCDWRGMKESQDVCQGWTAVTHTQISNHESWKDDNENEFSLSSFSFELFRGLIIACGTEAVAEPQWQKDCFDLLMFESRHFRDSCETHPNAWVGWRKENISVSAEHRFITLDSWCGWISVSHYSVCCCCVDFSPRGVEVKNGLNGLIIVERMLNGFRAAFWQFVNMLL